MGCISNAWILLGHCTLIPYQFNGIDGIVLVQRYFIVIADSVHCIRIGIRGVGVGGGGYNINDPEQWRLITGNVYKWFDKQQVGTDHMWHYKSVPGLPVLWPVYLLGNFQYGGVAWVTAFYITNNTTVSQKLILVDSTRNIRKLSNMVPLLGNHRSSMDSPYQGPATREAFWCHRVMMQA